MLSAWRRTRSLDVVAAIVVVSLSLGLVVALWAGDARFALVKAAPAFALFGVACLATLSARRPLMFFVGRHFAPGDAAAKVAEWDQRLTRPDFRDAMRRLTLLWGVACLIEAALGIAAAFLLPIGTALVVEPAFAIATVALLLTWTRRFANARPAQARDGGDNEMVMNQACDAHDISCYIEKLNRPAIYDRE